MRQYPRHFGAIVCVVASLSVQQAAYADTQTVPTDQQTTETISAKTGLSDHDRQIIQGAFSGNFKDYLSLTQLLRDHIESNQQLKTSLESMGAFTPNGSGLCLSEFDVVHILMLSKQGHMLGALKGAGIGAAIVGGTGEILRVVAGAHAETAGIMALIGAAGGAGLGFETSKVLDADGILHNIADERDASKNRGVLALNPTTSNPSAQNRVTGSDLVFFHPDSEFIKQLIDPSSAQNKPELSAEQNTQLNNWMHQTDLAGMAYLQAGNAYQKAVDYYQNDPNMNDLDRAKSEIAQKLNEREQAQERFVKSLNLLVNLFNKLAQTNKIPQEYINQFAVLIQIALPSGYVLIKDSMAFSVQHQADNQESQVAPSKLPKL